MEDIRCHIPITLQLYGQIEQRHEEALLQRTAQAIETHIDTTQRIILERTGPPDSIVSHNPEITFSGEALSIEDQNRIAAAVQEGILRAIRNTGIGGVTTPRRMRIPGIRRQSSTSQSTPGRRRGRPWRVVGSGRADIVLEDFVTYMEDIIENQVTEEIRALYHARLGEEARVIAWTIEALEDQFLEEQLIARVQAHIQDRFTDEEDSFYFSYSSEESARTALINLDPESNLSSVPSLSGHENMIAWGHASGTLERRKVILAGGRILFVRVVLPRVNFNDNIITLAPVEAELPVENVSFLVGRESFRNYFDIDWDDFVRENPGATATLTIQPMHAFQDVPYETLLFLMQQYIATQVPPHHVYFGRLRILSEDVISSLPNAIQSGARAASDQHALSKQESDSFGEWSVGTTGGFIYVALKPTEEQRRRATHRPAGRQLADAVINMLNRRVRYGSGSLRWQHDFQELLSGTPGATLEFMLEKLEAQNHFDAFFDAVDEQTFFENHHEIIRLALRTRFGQHARVTQSIRALNERFAAGRFHTYYPNSNSIDLRNDPDYHVPERGVMGEAFSLYAKAFEEQRVKPARLEALRTAVAEQQGILAMKILTGEDTRSFNDDSFAREVLNNAMDAIGFSEDDLETVDVRISARILEVERRIEDGLIRHYVTFELVRQYNDEPWQTIAGSRTQMSEARFEELTEWWPIVQVGEFIQTMAMVVAIGTVVLLGVAFAPELIALAGGWKVMLASIAISELIYVLRVIFTDEEFSVEGFLVSALDGYLMAVGFRAGMLVGGSLARSVLNTNLARREVGAWIVNRLATGALGGASSGVLIQFSHDVINIALDRQEGLSGLGDYLSHMAWGAALGVLFEFGLHGVLVPAFRAAGRPGAQTATQSLEAVQRFRGTTGDLVRQLRTGEVTLREFATSSLSTLRNLGRRLREAFPETTATEIQTAFRERLQMVIEHWGGQVRSSIYSEALELLGMELSQSARTGLERLLRSGGNHLDDAATRALLDGLYSNNARARSFLEALDQLDDAAVANLSRHQQLQSLLESPRVRGMIINNTDLSKLLLTTEFGGVVTRFENYLDRLVNLTDDVALRNEVLLALQGPHAYTAESLLINLERLGRLSELDLIALNRLYGSRIGDRTLDGILASTGNQTYRRLLIISRQLPPESLAEIHQQGMLIEVAHSPRVRRFIAENAWPSAHRHVHRQFEGSVANFEEFLDRLANVTDDVALRQQVLTAMQRPHSFSTESILQHVEKLGRLTQEDIRALNRLYEQGHLTSEALDNALNSLEPQAYERLLNASRHFTPETPLEPFIEPHPLDDPSGFIGNPDLNPGESAGRPIPEGTPDELFSPLPPEPQGPNFNDRVRPREQNPLDMTAGTSFPPRDLQHLEARIEFLHAERARLGPIQTTKLATQRARLAKLVNGGSERTRQAIERIISPLENTVRTQIMREFRQRVVLALNNSPDIPFVVQSVQSIPSTVPGFAERGAIAMRTQGGGDRQLSMTIRHPVDRRSFQLDDFDLANQIPIETKSGVSVRGSARVEFGDTSGIDRIIRQLRRHISLVEAVDSIPHSTWRTTPGFRDDLMRILNEDPLRYVDILEHIEQGTIIFENLL